MDYGGEAARPATVVEFTELVMAGTVQGGGEAHIHTGTLDTQLLHGDIFDGQFAARRGSFDSITVYHNPAESAARRGSFENSAVYHIPAEFAPHVRSAAGRGELLVAVFHDEPGPGVVYANVGDFWPQPGPGDEVPVAGLPLLVREHDNHGYYQLLPRQGAGRGDTHLLPDGVGAAYDNYGYRVQQLPLAGAGRGEVLVNLITDDAAGAVYGPGNFAQEGSVGALRGPNIGTGYDGSVALDDGLLPVYDNHGMVGEYLRRLLAFVGIGACSVAVNGLAAAPGSPAVAFQLYALLLGSLFLVILHVLRV